MAQNPIIQQIEAALSVHPEVTLAIVFGSIAKGAARPDSDVDLAVFTSRPLTAEHKMTLVGDIAQATGRAVDLVDLRTAGEPLMGQILAHGHRLMGSDEDFGTLVSRHLIDNADFMPYVKRMLAERRQAWIGK